MNTLPSQFQINQNVIAFGMSAHVRAVKFSEAKITYDIDLVEGGETLRNVDSSYVQAGQPGSVSRELPVG